jgi:hypothetical protein
MAVGAVEGTRRGHRANGKERVDLASGCGIEGNRAVNEEAAIREAHQRHGRASLEAPKTLGAGGGPDPIGESGQQRMTGIAG